MDIDTFIITHIFLIFFSTLNVQYLHKRNYLRKRSGAQISRSGNKLEGGSRSKYADSRTQSFPNTICSRFSPVPGPPLPLRQSCLWESVGFHGGQCPRQPRPVEGPQPTLWDRIAAGSSASLTRRHFPSLDAPLGATKVGQGRDPRGRKPVSWG